MSLSQNLSPEQEIAEKWAIFFVYLARHSFLLTLVLNLKIMFTPAENLTQNTTYD